MNEWSEQERDDLCDALSAYSTKRALSDEARVDLVIRAVDRIYAARVLARTTGGANFRWPQP